MIIKPTNKQLKYISNLQRYRRDVPEFTGKTIQEASEFISRYKDNPNKYEKDWTYIYDRPVFADDDYPYFDDSDIDFYQESMYRSCFF